MNFDLRRLAFLPAVAATILLGASIATAQTTPSTTAAKNEVAQATVASNKTASSVMAVPVLTDYRGIRIGMTVDDVWGKLGHLQEKGKIQDFFVLSDTESAQVFYDKDGKVTAVSADYVGKNSNPPTPREVLGEDLQAKADGSMYDLRRYPSAGYWVAYNRTAGNDPTVTITIQGMR